ncbi:hypothetical protein CTA2_4069 [Colletotrichum tanaceti]|nr:hypothetical protein CTA2_4069 [Colletotrichum tanaceti]
MFQQLIPTLGYGWTTRALALVVTVFLVVPNLLARPRLPPRSTGPIVELGAFKGLSYTLFAIGIFLVFWGVYFAFYYLSSFGGRFQKRVVQPVPGSQRHRYYNRSHTPRVVGRLLHGTH